MMVEHETFEYVRADAPAQQAPRYGGRLTSDERRRAIIDAARHEFARVGFHGASTSAIAQRADCSEPMLYKHFRGKRDLFIAVLRDSIEHYQVWFDATVVAHAGSSNLRELASSLVRTQLGETRFLELMRLRMLAVTLQDDDEVRSALAALDRATQERIAAFVRHGIEHGQVDPATDPTYVAWGWAGFMLAACYREALEPGTFGSMTTFVDRFIDSLSPS